MLGIQCVSGKRQGQSSAPSSPIPVRLPSTLRFTETFCIVVNSIKILETKETPIDREWLHKLRRVHAMQSLRALEKSAAALLARWWDYPQDTGARAGRWQLRARLLLPGLQTARAAPCALITHSKQGVFNM